MATDLICTNCNAPIELTEAMKGAIDAEVKRRLEKKLGKEVERIQAEAKEEIRTKEIELGAALKKAAQSAEREAELIKQQRAVEERAAQLELDVERRVTEETLRIRSAVEGQAEERMQVQLQKSLGEKDAELESMKRRLAEAAQKEARLLQRERQLDDRAQQLDLDVEQRLAEERQRLKETAEQLAEQKYKQVAEQQVQGKDAELRAARQQLEALRTQEAEVLRRQREIEEQRAQLEIDVQRRINDSARDIREASDRRLAERMALEKESAELRDKEHEERLRQMESVIDDLKQKLTQGSMQIQGEAQELLLRDLLRSSFPGDLIEDVEKGASGADLMQMVRDIDGRDCGRIVWESKRTKNWSDDWLPKLRDDERAAEATCAILVTQALPESIKGFGEMGGVWVCAWSYALPLATIVRAWLVEVADTRRAGEGRADKAQRLYSYLTGPQFRNRLEGVVEAYVSMRKEIDVERRSLMTIWRKREKQLDRALENLTAFYGDLRGLAGGQLEEMDALKLPAPSSESSHPRLEEGGEDGPDGTEPVALDADGMIDGSLVNLLWTLIPADGAPVGNMALESAFRDQALIQLSRTVGEQEYRVCREALLVAGRIRKGKGKGGSVMRIADAGEDAA